MYLLTCLLSGHVFRWAYSKIKFHFWSICLDHVPRFCDVVCAGSSLCYIFHTSQSTAGQCYIPHLIRSTNQVLGKGLQVSPVLYLTKMFPDCGYLLFLTCMILCNCFSFVIELFDYFSTKRVDHTNTRLQSQLERNPGITNLYCRPSITLLDEIFISEIPPPNFEPFSNRQFDLFKERICQILKVLPIVGSYLRYLLGVWSKNIFRYQ